MEQRVSTPAPPGALFKDDVARVLNVSPGTIKAYLRDAKRGLGRRRRNFPLPDGYELRTVPSPNTPSQPTRRTWSPWWLPDTIQRFVDDDRRQPSAQARDAGPACGECGDWHKDGEPHSDRVDG